METKVKDPEYYNNLVLLEKREKEIQQLLIEHEVFRREIAHRNTEIFLNHLKDQKQ